MPSSPVERTRQMTIVAQDPRVLGPQGRILTERVTVPAEELGRGPCGHRVHVVDYDATTQTLYAPYAYPRQRGGKWSDPFIDIADAEILDDPRFHAQNVYAIVMRTLGRFEFALGRRVGW